LLNSDDYRYLFSNDSDSINLNGYFLKSVPQSFSEDSELTVFYYIFKPEYPKVSDIDFVIFLRDTIGTKVSKIFGNLGSYASLVNYISSSSVIDSYSGVVITNNIKYDEEDFSNIKNNIDFRDCYVIVPKDNYD
jgi:hypothetical protein